MTNNSTFGGCHHAETSYHLYIRAVIVLPICFVIVLENVVGIATIWRTPSLHTNTNRLISSLAVTDIIVAIAFICSGLHQLQEVYALFPYANFIDTFLFANMSSMVVLSCLHMSIIAVDRYFYIAHPFYYTRNFTQFRSRAVLLSAWVVGLVLQLVPMIIYTDSRYHVHCIFLYPPIAYYAICLGSYPAALTVVFVFYLKIALLAYKRKKAATARKLYAPNILNVSETDPTGPGYKVSTPALKSVKFFIAMFGVFSIFTGTPSLAIVVRFFHPLPDGVYGSLLCLYVLNSGSSFMLYAWMNKEFSQALKKTFKDMSNCCRKKRDYA